MAIQDHAVLEVIIPAFNAEPYLRETLLSVAAQTHPADLVTVVNDASTDNTVAVARACARELADRVTIQIIDNTGPRGPSAARNTAIRQGNAEWIALLDSDDLLTPTHHSTLLRVVSVADDIILSFGDSTIFREQEILDSGFLTTSGVTAHPATEIAADCWTLGDLTFDAMLYNGVFGTSACLFRREAAITAGLFDEAMMQCEDTDFFMRLSLVGRFAFSRKIVAQKRVHEKNLSHDRHKLLFCRGTVLSLSKIANLRCLSAARLAAVGEALSNTVDGYLYHASRSGFSAYREATNIARKVGYGKKTANPRHLIRATLRGFFG